MYFSINVDGKYYNPATVKTGEAEAYFFKEEELKTMCLILYCHLRQFIQTITISLNFPGQIGQGMLEIPLLKIFRNESQYLNFINMPDYDKSRKILSEYSISLNEIAKEIEPILNYIQEILKPIINGVSDDEN